MLSVVIHISGVMKVFGIYFSYCHHQMLLMTVTRKH